MMIDKVSLVLLDVNLAFTDEDTECCLGSNNFHTFQQSEQISEIMCCRTRTQGFDSGCYIVEQLCASTGSRPAAYGE